MSFIKFFAGEKNESACLAKNRLQIILAHERRDRTTSKPEFLADLQRELIAVVSRYVKINAEDIQINLEHQDNIEVLEVKIELPDSRE